MNLIEQDAQPSAQAYRTCPICGKRITTPSNKTCSRACGATRLASNPDPSSDEISSGFRRIKLTQGQFAIIDEDDFREIGKFRWFAIWSPITRSFYAARTVLTGLDSPRQQRIFMARAIVGAPPGVFVDHEDGVTLNNRRSNLRIASPLENGRNRRKLTKGTSDYKGVSWCAAGGKWRAFIRVNYKPIYLGQFDREEDAADAYRKAAIKHHGEFASTSGYGGIV